jgi:hypothetical protein
MGAEVKDDVFQQLKSTGEGLRKGLWSADDLGTLRAIAADVAELEIKAQAALHGLPTDLPHSVGDIAHGLKPDPARAAMYRKAADRALDAAANLALVRMQAIAGQVDAIRDSFISRVWKAISDLVPGLSSSAPSDAPK